jgi:trehalose utilization protein
VQDVDLDQLFVVNGEVIATPPAETQEAYVSWYSGAGKPGAHRLAFRRADGSVTFLQPQLKPFLNLFREPVTLAEANDRKWVLDKDSANRVWHSLIRLGLIRRVLPPAADQPSELARSA